MDKAAYPRFCTENQDQLHLLLRLTKALAALLEVPIVTENGELHPAQELVANNARKLLAEAGNGTA